MTLKVPCTDFDLENNAMILSRGITFGHESKCAISLDNECEYTSVQGWHIINLSSFGFALLSMFRRIISFRFIRKFMYAKHFTGGPVVELKRVTSSRKNPHSLSEKASEQE